MTHPIPMIGAVPSATAGPVRSTAGAFGANSTAAASPATTGSSGVNQLNNTQTFLQLLVAQLKNQDPSNPSDPTQFMTEIAQMTAVQSQNTLDAEEQTVAANSMIGRTVTAGGGGAPTVSGVVDGVLLSSSGAPMLEVTTTNGVQDVSLTSVTQVTNASA